MTTTKKASMHGARRVTAALDQIATLFQSNHESLGIPQKVAMDFALRCDMLSDSIQRGFGAKNAGFFNPAEIAEEVPGPLINDPTQPFMDSHFTQEWFNALTDKQESGELASNAEKHLADPKLASDFVQKVASAAVLTTLRALATRKAEEEPAKEEKPSEDEAKKEASKKASKPVKAAEEAEKEETEEPAEGDAKKSAAVFGLFSDK